VDVVGGATVLREVVGTGLVDGAVVVVTVATLVVGGAFVVVIVVVMVVVAGALLVSVVLGGVETVGAVLVVGAFVVVTVTVLVTVTEGAGGITQEETRMRNAATETSRKRGRKTGFFNLIQTF
jgi:hypothetical protein